MTLRGERHMTFSYVRFSSGFRTNTWKSCSLPADQRIASPENSPNPSAPSSIFPLARMSCQEIVVLDFPASSAAGIIIWATTATDFLLVNPRRQRWIFDWDNCLKGSMSNLSQVVGYGQWLIWQTVWGDCCHCRRILSRWAFSGHRKAIAGYRWVMGPCIGMLLMDMSLSRKPWGVHQNDGLLFWVPFEHRQLLWLPRVETIGAGQQRWTSSGTAASGLNDPRWLKELEGDGEAVRVGAKNMQVCTFTPVAVVKNFKSLKGDACPVRVLDNKWSWKSIIEFSNES